MVFGQPASLLIIVCIAMRPQESLKSTAVNGTAFCPRIGPLQPLKTGWWQLFGWPLWTTGILMGLWSIRSPNRPKPLSWQSCYGQPWHDGSFFLISGVLNHKSLCNCRRSLSEGTESSVSIWRDEMKIWVVTEFLKTLQLVSILTTNYSIWDVNHGSFQRFFLS